MIDNNRMQEEIKSFEKLLSQNQELLQNGSDMEQKLREFETKLQKEEEEKNQLEAQYNEAKKDVSENIQKLSEKDNEIELLLKDKLETDRIKAECEELKSLIDKEKKAVKDLTSQNVRLNSLVKIGEESIKMEQEKVKLLETQLNNGSLSLPVNCPAANGSPESVPHNLTLCDSSEEGASVKK